MKFTICPERIPVIAWAKVRHRSTPTLEDPVKRSLKLSAVAATALALLLSGCSPSSPDGGNADGTTLPNDGCTQIVVATSSEKVNLMEDLGKKFKESSEHSALGTCATVTPINIASGRGSELFSQGGKEWTVAGTPAPVIWSPASTVWTDRVASIAGPKIVAGAESFAKTPVVFGMPESMARALDYPAKPLGIKDLQALVSNPQGWGSVGKSIWGSFKIAKTNPNTSTTGLSTILMQSYAASGKTADLTAADVQAAEDFSRSFESGAIHYGDTTGKVLLNLAENSTGSGSSYVSAIALEETSLYNYNIGNPDSHTVQPGEQLTPPSEKLVAVYPSEGTIWSDNPAVVLGADWVTPEQKTAGDAFLAFLKTKIAQETLPQYGFRPVDDTVDVSGSLNGSVGIDPAQPAVTLPKPEADVVSAALDQWTQIRKPSAILQLIDISGSMDTGLPEGGKTRLEAAIESSRASLGQIRPTDEIGVWAFTTGLSSVIDGENSSIVAEIRPFGTLGSDKEKLQNSIGDLLYSNRAGTPLYDALSFGYDYMKDHAETGRINAIVVISDGEDTDSQSSIDSLVQQIRKDTGEGGNSKPVKIFAIGFGENADMDALNKLAAASGGQAFDATDPAKIGQVLQSVMNNF